MDFFQSHQTVPKPLLSYLLPPNVQLQVKRLAGSPKGWNWSQPALTLTKCYSVAHAFLYTLMDFFQSHQTVPSRCYLTFFHFPERSIALVKRLAGSPKGWIDPNLPHANKVLLKVAHAFLYTLMDFFQSQTVAKPLLSYLLPFSRRSIALVKRLAGSPKGWNWSQPYANKVLLKVAHAFLYTLMDFFQSHQTVPNRCYLTFFHFPERSIALVKRLAGSPKGWNWSQPATLTKCYSR
jgi:hypothetical protein